MKQGNLLIVHGGAPTAVINSSLYGAVTEAKKHPEVEKVLGAVGGTGGMLKENFCDLSAVPEERLKLLLQTPASAIGTSRDALEPEHYAAMAEICRKHNIRWVLFNGGNGSMDACGKLFKACVAAGVDVRVVGIPKTVDNDIAVTDHAPGFGSAARFIAGITSEISQDVRSLPIHVSVIEAMGRNAGWVTAASALAAPETATAQTSSTCPSVPSTKRSSWRRWATSTARRAAWSWWPARASPVSTASPSWSPSSRWAAPPTTAT